MSRRSLLAFSCMGLLSLPALAHGQAQPACCAKPAEDAEAGGTPNAEKAGKLRCSLTGKVVDKCCCEQREGKTYCTLAKKSVEACCCSPVSADTKPGK